MDFVDCVIEALEIATYCFLLGFCGSAGMVSAFWVCSRFFEDEDDRHGVIGH